MGLVITRLSQVPGDATFKHRQTLWRWSHQEATGLVVTLFRGLCAGSGQQTRLVSSLLYLGQDGAPWRYTQSCRLSCAMTRCRRWWVFLPIISFWSLYVLDIHIVQNDMYVCYIYYRPLSLLSLICLPIYLSLTTSYNIYHLIICHLPTYPFSISLFS